MPGDMPMRLVIAQRCLIFIAVLRFAQPLPAAEKVDYLRDIKPIFKKHCYACHGALKQEAAFRADTADAVRRGGDSGPAIEPGSVTASHLLDRLSATDEATRMPRESLPLAASEIAAIAAWIEQGAEGVAGEQPEADPRDHWAFRRAVRPDIPQVDSSPLMIRNPIDAFIAAEQRRHQLQPVKEAAKTALLRRVTLDLIGLPPTRDELHSFLDDDSPKAYERVVDRLLASPHYGERWGRHWMDVWRYSDWYGRRSVPDVMSSYPTIWRWRDWIVESLNSDKGYDRMIVEMLAGDEVAPDDDRTIVATGFLVRNWFKWNYGQWMKDNVEHTGKAFLGLTFNCAHCHDHKYDPISQRDYFALRAFFEPLDLRQDRVAGEPDPGKFKDYVYTESYGPIAGGMIRVYDRRLDAVTKIYARGDERSIVESEPPVEPGLPAFFDFPIPRIHEIDLPPVAVYPGLKPFIAEEELAKMNAAIAASQQKLNDAQARLAAEEATRVAAVDAAKLELDRTSSQTAQQKPAALAGKQSLFINALHGRRTLSCDVAALGEVRNGTTFTFEVLIETDTHANFQLGLDPVAGKTAAFVGFEQGRIVTFAPGTSSIIEIGRYDFAAGQRHFKVAGKLDVDQDRVTIDVINVADGQAIVRSAVTSLNHWNPGADPHQGIFLDAQAGSVAAFDEISFAHPGESPVIYIDFEEPQFASNQDVVGKLGWTVSPFAVAPAFSLVSGASTLDATLNDVRKKLAAAQRGLDALRLSPQAADAELAAAKQELVSLQARIAAGRARHEQANNVNFLAKDAALVERTATSLKLTAAELNAELSLAELEGKAAADDQIAAGKAALVAAHQAVLNAKSAATSDDSSDEFTLLSPTYPTKSTGRRTVLAKAIANRDNPLTARVAVNHIWMRHFGQPLVETVFDFGRNGKPPTHPELLDWLAVEFMENDWSMQLLHRLIVLSSTYRLDTRMPAESVNRQLDTDNKFLWRFNRKRMESELVRDSMLFVSGQLDPKMGGPEVEIKDAAACRRRSIYLSHHGENRAPLMAAFDGADPSECYRRVESVVPQQALALANGDLAIESSRVAARRLRDEIAAAEPDHGRDDTVFVDAAYELLLTRKPTPLERQASMELLERQRKAFSAAGSTGDEPTTTDGTRPSVDPAMRARESLCHALLNCHDFISIP
jgi:hypothetical protein